MTNSRSVDRLIQVYHDITYYMDVSIKDNLQEFESSHLKKNIRKAKIPSDISIGAAPLLCIQPLIMVPPKDKANFNFE